MKLARTVAGVLCVCALLAAPLQAADDPVDPDFLEFLGSVDSSEAGWHDYLAATDVDALLKAQAAAAKAAASDPPPPADGSEKKR